LLSNFGVKNSFLSSISAYKVLDEKQAIGVGFRYYAYGDVKFTDDNGIKINDFRPKEYAIDLGYARLLNDALSIGVNLRFIHSALVLPDIINASYKPANAIAADVSLTYNQIAEDGSGYIAATRLSNLGSKMNYGSTANDFLPANWGLGIAMKLPSGDGGMLTLTADVNKLLVPRVPETTNNYAVDSMAIIEYGNQSVISSWAKSFADGSSFFKTFRASTGIEYAANNSLAVRAGYFFEDIKNGNAKYFTMGLSIKYKIVGIDLSYIVPSGIGINRSPLANTIRLGINFFPNIEE
jgi:opacity protein-like surface antigen